jgi:hypothetical protein
MPRLFRDRGSVVIALTAFLALAIATVFTTALARMAGGQSRAKASDASLAMAKEALVAYASSRPIDDVVGPGYLPCPDLDDDGWAESTCGSMSGETGQWQRLGRLPWKTLGLPDLRDGFGERLWYAVSSKHKGLLNCTVSAACLDMSPTAAIGTITVRDQTGTVIHDGTLAGTDAPTRGGAVAVVFAPGPVLSRWTGPAAAGRLQDRTCDGGRCDAAGHCLTDPPTLTPKCNPENYLDRSPGPAFADEDNATFIDRNDSAGRLGNRDGFIHGPVVGPDGRTWVNDRLAVLTYQDIMPRVMRRVADEVASCLRAYASERPNGGRLPWAAPLCRAQDPVPSLRFSDAAGVRFGRVPDTPFTMTVRDSALAMQPRWPAGAQACAIADAAGATAGLTRLSWWNTWKSHIFYAAAPAASPSSLPRAACDAASCLASEDPADTALSSFAVIAAGAPLRFGPVSQARGPSAELDIRNWLEGANAELRRLNPNPDVPTCPEDGSRPRGPAGTPPFRYAAARGPDINDVVVAGLREAPR